VGIQVDTGALHEAARGYQDAAAAVRTLHSGLSSALDQVAAAAANDHVAAGTASLHTGLTTALRALADSSNQYATKVSQAAARYRAADVLPGGQPADAANPPPATRSVAPATPPTKPDKAWWEIGADAVTSFGAGLFVDGLWDTVKGLGHLVGVGGWDVLKDSWGGLLKFVLSLSPVAQAANAVTDLPYLPQGTLWNTLKDAGKGLVAWDQWEDDPARATGHVVFNAASIVVGPKVVGAGAKGAVGSTKTAATAGGRAGAAGTDAAEVARLAEINKLIAAQRADAAAEAVGRPGLPSAGDVRLDKDWGKPKGEYEPGRIKELDSVERVDNWHENIERGDDFNRVRERDRAYETGELPLENRKKVDGYTPPEGGRPGEIVSRKDTQLAEIRPETADGHLEEALRKYRPGTAVADTPANRANYPDLIGKPLSGQAVLEVPVQRQPVPPDFAARARRLGVTIRDYTGKVYN
jgi:hypothetical protein